jgi:hypothetical protein
MSTETKSKAASATQSTWSGNMELTNNTGYTITNVSFEHTNQGSKTVTCTLPVLGNNGDSPSVAFSTVSGPADVWYVSYLDVSNNLITGHLTADFHQGSAGSTVEFSLLPGNFTVTISGSTSTGSYDQK